MPKGEPFPSQPPSAPLSVASEGPPVVLYAHRAKADNRPFSRDVILTRADPSVALYYLEFHQRIFRGSWHLVLHSEGARDGPAVCTIFKQAFGSNFDLTLLPTRFTTHCFRSSIFGGTKYKFLGSDGTTYEWRLKYWSLRPDGPLVCVRLEGGKKPKDCPVVAEWEPKNWSLKKEGTLKINLAYEHEKDLLVATVLSLTEWLCEKKAKTVDGEADSVARG
ncbi:hypothetical protein JCM1840_004515 [Sporobolomyces johnsonii]